MIEVFKHFFESLFPKECIICNFFLSPEEKFLCEKCFFSLPYLFNDPYNILDMKLLGKLNYKWALSLLSFKDKNKTRKVIHAMKYDNSPDLGLKFGRLLGNRILQSKLCCDFETLIPVPMHQKKMLKRGYNQAECIAEGISQIFSIKLDNTVLFKSSETDSQTNKSKNIRVQNVSQSFSVLATACNKYRSVLLVDDVVTTGSTIIECVKCLNFIGIPKVAIASLACAN